MSLVHAIVVSAALFAGMLMVLDLRPSTKPLERCSTPEASRRWTFAAVTDLDHRSRTDKFLWFAYLQSGYLTQDVSGMFSVEVRKELKLESTTSGGNRSMELSAIEVFGGRLLAFCDRSGIVFDINPIRHTAQVRALVRSGDGKTNMAFKTEWVTEKDGLLVIGSTGKEWVEKGVVTHGNLKWVKHLDTNWKFHNVPWEHNYERIRAHAGAQYPGYMLHESGIWEPSMRSWIFLPRKLSIGVHYTEEADEVAGNNVLYIVSEDFSSIRNVTIGPLEREWGFSDVKVLPRLADGEKDCEGAQNRPLRLVGIKVREVGEDNPETKLCVFDLEGKFYTNPMFLPVTFKGQDYKFEGIAFIPDHYRHKTSLV